MSTDEDVSVIRCGAALDPPADPCHSRFTEAQEEEQGRRSESSLLYLMLNVSH